MRPAKFFVSKQRLLGETYDLGSSGQSWRSGVSRLSGAQRFGAKIQPAVSCANLCGGVPTGPLLRDDRRKGNRGGIGNRRAATQGPHSADGRRGAFQGERP